MVRELAEQEHRKVKEPMISLACHRAMMDAVMHYVPHYQRENARAAATAVGVGYEPKR
jgi:hypothetical protein